MLSRSSRVLTSLGIFSLPICAVIGLGASPTTDLAPAINGLGLDLYRHEIKSAANQAVLLSPYSISTALAMAYAGADGETKAEMERVLRLPRDRDVSSAAFQGLERALQDVVKRSEQWAQADKAEGADTDPIQLKIANRLFVQRDFSLRPAFTEHIGRYFFSTLAPLDFKHAPVHARDTINQWIAAQTQNRITQILSDAPSEDTRLAMVNALYLKAPWENSFEEEATKNEPFHLSTTQNVSVPTMQARRRFGYAKENGYSVVAVPYKTGSLQLVLFVPDNLDGLPLIEKSLTTRKLAEAARLKPRDVIFHLPKFKLEPAALELGKPLEALGLKTAFDQPTRSANFDRMAPRTPGSYLSIGQVLHKTWLSVDEKGSEAAAATVAVIYLSASMPSKPPPPPIEVRVDRPFLFAIQHVESGVCLFLGRVTDPR